MVMGLWCCIRGFYLEVLLIKKIQHQITLQKMILVKERSLGVNRIRKVMLGNLFVDRFVSKVIVLLYYCSNVDHIYILGNFS